MAELWRQLSQPLSTLDLNALSFPSAMVGYAGGGYDRLWSDQGRAALLETTDGGSTWHHLSSPPLEVIRQLSFPTEDIGYIAGWQPGVLKTTDGGATWHVADLPFPDAIFHLLVFRDPLRGYAQGSRAREKQSADDPPSRENTPLLVTLDGGDSWSQATVDPFSGSWPGIASLAFPSSDVGYAYPSLQLRPGSELAVGDLLLTEDSGLSWWIWPLPMGSGEIQSLAFPTPERGFLAGGGGIYRTSDEGATWEKVFYRESLWITRIAFSGAEYGWAIGADTLLTTRDGGSSWTDEPLPIRFGARLQALACPGAGQVCLAGDDGVLCTTQDYGRNWAKHRYGVHIQSIKAIRFPTERTGYILGGNYNHGLMYRTHDDAASWQEMAATMRGYRACAFVGDHHCYLLPKDSGVFVSDTRAHGGSRQELLAGHGVILASADGGETWTEQPLGVYGVDLYDLAFTNHLNGFVVGASGTLLVTVDGGVDWSQHPLGTDDLLYRITFPTPNTGYILADSHSLLITRDAGRSWTRRETGAKFRFVDLCFTSAMDGYAVGYRDGRISRNFAGGWGEILYRTSDGGTTWGLVGTPNEDEYFTCAFSNQRTGYLLTKEWLYTTRDSGSSWERSPRLPWASHMGLGRLAVAPSGHPYVVSPRAVVLTLASARSDEIV